jgi:hypothetical protein
LLRAQFLRGNERKFAEKHRSLIAANRHRIAENSPRIPANLTGIGAKRMAPEHQDETWRGIAATVVLAATALALVLIVLWWFGS